LTKSYKNMVAFGNHFKATTWSSVNNMVTYDYGVLGVFERTQPITRDNPNQISEFVTYTRECQEILILDYGMTKVPMLLCSWV
jgi:hypothetical protein